MKSFFLSAVILLLFLPAASIGQERGLEFLSHVPELRGLSLRMSEDEFKTQVEKHGLYVRKETQKEGVSYWVLTPEGENVFAGFMTGRCTGIQRMQPVPRQRLQEQIGAAEYEAWMAKRKAAARDGVNGSAAKPKHVLE